MHKCFWGWLFFLEQSYALQTPGLTQEVTRRRMLTELFSLLLIAEREPGAPRCLFARWLEWTQARIARRKLIALARNLKAIRLLAKCFSALHTGLKPAHNEDPDCWRLDNVRSDVSKWATHFMRPPLYSDWVRRRNAWLRRRALRNAIEADWRRNLVLAHANVEERIKQERTLLFEWLGKDGEHPKQVFWTGALQLREKELRKFWKQCDVLVKRLAIASEEQSDEYFSKLGAVSVCLGFGRWLFNALSRGMPRVGAPLPEKRLLPKYWKHLEDLVAKSEQLTERARLVNS
jgi:hypothetical protein